MLWVVIIGVTAEMMMSGTDLTSTPEKFFRIKSSSIWKSHLPLPTLFFMWNNPTFPNLTINFIWMVLSWSRNSTKLTSDPVLTQLQSTRLWQRMWLFMIELLSKIIKVWEIKLSVNILTGTMLWKRQAKDMNKNRINSNIWGRYQSAPISVCFYGVKRKLSYVNLLSSSNLCTMLQEISTQCRG